MLRNFVSDKTGPVMKSRYKVYNQEGIHFVTSTIIEWIPVFTSKKYFDAVIESLKFCRMELSLKLYAFVILDNHFHLIISANDISKTMQSFKKYTAKQILSFLK